MARLKRYVEWMTRGRRTQRVVYAINEWNIPKPLPGAEWQLDSKFDVSEALLRDPELKTVLKAAIEKGAEIVNEKSGS
jgi:hypothetical protein